MTLSLSSLLVRCATFALMISHSTATQPDSKIQPLILGGTEVPIGLKKFVTGVRETAKGTDFCGGSLISPKHVLTAAHCQAGPIKFVSVGTHFLGGTKDGEQIRVVKQTLHPNRTDGSNSWDFLVLELERAVANSAPVALARRDDSDIVVGKNATVLGWGATREGGKQSQVLLQVDVRLVDNAECAKKLPVDDTMVCAGGRLNEDSCQGDSGGPLIVSNSTSNFDVLVGVVSFGNGCGREGFPGVYARVSRARDWLDSVAPGLMWR